MTPFLNPVLQKVNDLNRDPKGHLLKVRKIISDFKDHLNGRTPLDIQSIQNLVQSLLVYTTMISISFPLNGKTYFTRAVKLNKDETNGLDYFTKLSRLSYIRDTTKHSIKMARFNQNNTSMYYCCLNANGNSLGSALSELNAKEGDIFNILVSVAAHKNCFTPLKPTLEIIPIGVFDYFRRGAPTPFELHDVFIKTYECYVENSQREVMLALQLCDAFLIDILTAKGSNNLYDITACLATECLKPNVIDGFIYPSTRFDGYPNLVLKPYAVDTKLIHIMTKSIIVEDVLGFGICKTRALKFGFVNNEVIEWVEIDDHRIQSYQNINT